MSTLYRAKVVRSDDSGVYVEIPELGEDAEWGPLEMLSIPLLVGDPVLVGSINDILEDLALLGKLVTEAQVAPSIPPFPPTNSRYILYYENEAARTAAAPTVVSGLATWLDDEQRLDVYTDEVSAGYVSFYGVKSDRLILPTGVQIGMGTGTPGSNIDIVSGASTTGAIASGVSGEAAHRLKINAAGLFEWSDGTGAADVSLSRNSTGPGLTVNSRLSVGGNPATTASFTARQSTNRVGFFSNNTEASVTHSLAHFYAIEAGNTDSRFAASYMSSETAARWYMESGGKQWWGPGGATAPDTSLTRGGVGWLQTNGGLDVATFLDVGGALDVAGPVYARDILMAGPTDNDVGRGLWVQVISNVDSATTSGTTELILLTTASTTFKADRAYEIRFSQRFTQSVATASIPFFMFKKTNAAGQQLTDLGREQFPASSSTFRYSGFSVFVIGNADVTAAICQTVTPSAATNITQKGSASFPRSFQIWDIGPASKHTGQPILV